jgi:hypothetical protein
MLESLFGSKNVQKILIFLFVNDKCYGSQLHRLLKTPLTPIQKALMRLEKGEIITSFHEGKTKLYRFNPSFPVLEELERLIKKTYTLLSPQEKKCYHCLKAEKSIGFEENKRVVLAFWKKLLMISQMTFIAKSKSEEPNGWNGKGKGTVQLSTEVENAVVFTEKGLWTSKNNEEMNFSNVFRWTLDKETATISLEHLRRGSEHPVFLFHLSPTGARSLTSIDPHLCENDVYFGQIHFDTHSIRLNWRMIGPKKNEEIDYFYR